MLVKIKKLHPNAKIPSYANVTDAGMDLTAISSTTNGLFYEYNTGLSIEIPQGHVGLIFPRSSISKTSMVLANSVGILDSGYRGEIRCRFKNFGHVAYEVGDKVAQLVILPYPTITFEVVEELSESERGENGFGSSGN